MGVASMYMHVCMYMALDGTINIGAVQLVS